MKAAISAGADAVYIGGSRFGARAYAENLDEEQMLKAIDYAHLRGVSLYMTVNTLVKEREFNGLYAYLLPYYEHGLDAVIVQDLGVFAAVRQWFPDLRVHASTQMTVTGPEGAKLLRKMGAARVVTARELSLSELRAIHERTDIEIESFIHGALCYCYSGQCLLSSLIGGRSGNRGRCAQPCRLPYEVTDDGRILTGREQRYVMSMKDLCTLDILPDILESGVCSLKIEGRMKNPRYTAGVVSIYRRYLDLYMEDGRGGYRVDADDRKRLLDLFDRGGHTEGYYRRHNGKDMLVLREKPPHREINKVFFDQLDRTFVEKEKKVVISGRLTVPEGRPMELELWPEGGLEAPVSQWDSGMMGLEPRPEDGLEAPVSQSDSGTMELELWPEGGPEAPVSQRDSETTELEPQPEDRSAAGAAGVSDGARVKMSGAVVRTAKNQPLTADRLDRQMRKTGGTPFEFDRLDIATEGNGFVPVQALNELRRDGLAGLEEAILRPYRRQNAGKGPLIGVPADGDAWSKGPRDEAPRGKRRLESGPRDEVPRGKRRPESGPREKEPLPLHCLVSGAAQLEQALKEPDISEIQIESDAIPPKEWKRAALRCREAGKRCVIALPVIFRKEAEEFFAAWERELAGAGFDGFLVRSLEEISLIKRLFGNDPAPFLRADHDLYVFNHHAAETLLRLGFDGLTFPLELNAGEARELRDAAERGGAGPRWVTEDRRDAEPFRTAPLFRFGAPCGFELIAYGCLPVMTTAQCVRQTAAGCDRKQGILTLKDRTGRELPVQNHCAFCYNRIYDPEPLFLPGMEDTVRRLRPASLRLQFLTETPEQLSAVVRAYGDAFLRGAATEETAGCGADRRAAGGLLPARFTRGHLKRGVE